jgi:hypothetical protein
MSRVSATVSALALIGALASNPAEAVQRAFVASFGSDANTASNCTLSNPCRGFTAAMTVVDAGGEVVAMDAAGYGAVTITKSVTLTANPGFYAGISASTGNAITIATASVKVTLRGLNINSIGANNGVAMTDGSTLSVENCIISNFSGNGVHVPTGAMVRIVDSVIRENVTGVFLSSGATATISGTKILGNSNIGVYVSGFPASTTTTAAISDSVVAGNSSFGIYALAIAGATARASVNRTTAVNNVIGIAVDNGAGTQVIIVSNSLVTGNSQSGLAQAGATSTLKSLGNNTVDQNLFNIVGTLTTVSGS